MVVVDSVTLLTPAEVRWVVAQAVRAPSIHNSQPWRFRWDGAGFDLLADTTRGLAAIDPDGRELVLSCGAALFNLRLALRKLGLDTTTEPFPDPRNPRVLARVGVVAGSPASQPERLRYAALVRRHTHRGSFDPRPVSAELSVRLQQAAEAEGALLLYVNNPGSRHRLLHLARAAEQTLLADERVRDEIEAWTPATRRRDGIPPTAYPPGRAAAPDELAPRDFDLGRDIGTLAPGQAEPGAIAVLASATDVARDWLRAGQALESVLVTAAQHWVFAALHSQVIEVPNLRHELRQELPTASYPQLLLRFGHSGNAPTTPRRDPDDVLELVHLQAPRR